MIGRQVALFLMEATEETFRDLRRYRMGASPSNECPGRMGYHDAAVRYDRVPVVYADPDRKTIRGDVPVNEIPARDDPRWPTKCDGCEYLFAPEDEWQVFIESIYRRSDTGEEFTLRSAPAGAVWDCPWYESKGPDGKCICIMTPGGAWMPDLPSTSGTPWQRTGVLPKITCNPSILMPHGKPEYHAWLRDGVLIDC